MRSRKSLRTPFVVEFDREEDGRWIAEVQKLPGVMAYGATKQAALRRVYAIALRALADRAEEGRTLSPLSRLFTFAFHDREEIGPRMLARIATYTRLAPKDL